jgi:HicA toxin of bacterial toxin-antitoxin,
MSGYTRELKKILAEAGCKFLRHGKGDHEIWFSPISNRTFTVDNNIKSKHTANETLKQAGLEKCFQRFWGLRRGSPRLCWLHLTLLPWQSGGAPTSE